MRILLFCALLAAQYCIALDQSSAKLTEELAETQKDQFCVESRFLGFKQFQLSKKMALNKTEVPYFRSPNFTGYQRISELYVEGSKIPLKDSLSEIAKKYTNVYPPVGCKANCFNATINWFKGTTDIRKSYSSEIITFLSENFEELKAGSEIISGDVLYLYMPVDDGSGVRLKPFHTAIYIDSGIFWHKASDNSADPWTFEDLSKQLQNYCEKSDGEMLAKFYRKKAENP